MKDQIMSYEEFIKLVNQTHSYFNWTYGQSLMNVLHNVWKEKYYEIFKSEIDPYYKEENVSKVLEILKNTWKNQ